MTQTLNEDLVTLLGTEEETDILDELVEELRPRLQQALEQEDAHWMHLQQAFSGRAAKHKAKRERLTRMLKELGFEERKAKAKKSGTRPLPSREAVEKLVRWMATQDGPRTYADIVAALGIPNSSANKQVQVARELELVALAHMGGDTGRMMYFTVWNGAIERLDRGDVTWPQ